MNGGWWVVGGTDRAGCKYYRGLNAELAVDTSSHSTILMIRFSILTSMACDTAVV
jgi:hypothetical protein